MGETTTYAWHARRMLILGLPLIGSQVAQMAIQLTDAIMLGRYGVEALAGQVLGSTLFILLLLMGSGFAWGVMPLVAEADARGAHGEMRRLTRMALWLSAAFALACLPVLLLARPIFLLLGQTETLSRIGGEYLAIQGWSIFPALGVMVLRSALAGLERTAAVFWSTVGAVAVNAAVNHALIFGNWGAPEMGVAGAAWASVLSTGAGFAVLAVYTAWALPEHAILARLWRPDWEAMGRVFRIGWPIGLTTLAEVALFSVSAVLMGWLGTIPLAAHGIAMQITSITFMIHVGLSQAATIRAGNALGRRDGPGLRQGAVVALVLSGLVALVTSAVFLGLPEPLVVLFLGEADPARDEVLALGVALLAAAALFQMFDAAQVVGLGLLRGVQDTRRPLVYAAISYWGIGLPAAYALAFPLGMGGVGIWLGMALGLGVAGVLMLGRFRRRGAYAVEAGGVAVSNGSAA